MPRLGPGIKGLLMRHDLLFSVGGDLFTLSLPDDVDPMPPGLTVVHLDVDPWELGKNYPAAVAILGDPKATLPGLAEEVRRATGPKGHPHPPKRKQRAPPPGGSGRGGAPPPPPPSARGPRAAPGPRHRACRSRRPRSCRGPPRAPPPTPSSWTSPSPPRRGCATSSGAPTRRASSASG